MGETSTGGGICPVCLAALPPAPAVGRPPRYCSTACRRVAELEIRRINERLADLEARAAHVRMHGKTSCFAKPHGPGAALATINQEIARQRARLREVLDT